MNYLGLDYEDIMGTYVGSLDSITYRKRPVCSLVETPLAKIQDTEMGDQDVVLETDDQTYIVC